MPWYRVPQCDALAANGRVTAEIGGREILVCRIDAGLVAVANRCTHSAWPLSSEPIEGNEIVCTLHGARFDLRDGCPTAGPASRPLATYPVEFRDGELYVSL
ncbi:MAG TPA: non-heme iron oxygenase ferredoxin subunit [Deltaproteobacteria bacterium]|nr:non-heme iron oxygenase ferredoxin subunit [Deltaproteobacteria bacterium]